MATVIVSTAATTTRVVKPAHPKMKLITERGSVLVIPYAPTGVSMDNLAPAYQQTARYGRAPLLGRSGEPLPTLSFTLIVAYPDSQRSVEPILKRLRDYAKTKRRVRLAYGPSEAGWYRVTSASQESVMRQAGTNHITRATVSMTFTQASDAQLRISPLSGGTAPTSAPKASSSTRRHTVRAGDTLWALAVRYYGDGALWKRIADKNGIKDPRLLRIGAVLVIP